MRDLKSLKVLIIDDDLNMRKIVKSVLMLLGIKDISEATNGQEGYDLLKVPKATPQAGRRKYDLVICDWMMPVLDGLSLLERIKKDEALKQTPFLMATSESDFDKVLEAIKGGVSDYIVKPFTATILEEKLRKILQDS